MQLSEKARSRFAVSDQLFFIVLDAVDSLAR